ncbi:MAG: response regulator transcription factor [Spirochaetales bacterium]|nr:response regulator transcription factor [Spirochaetales bacterium]MBO6048676.1 response regulator transcription factor [Spirochaetales bacterium]MBO7348949.1 response regulator transcription factor [Spirochaetales bacterium]
MRVLLAEDEKRMASALVAILKQEKYDVDHVPDGESALSALESNIYDIAVLDVMMPYLNGFDVARKARSAGISTPILMLTAKSQVDDKVQGLDSGADDYLTKPFETKELLARLRALIRRKTNPDIRDGELCFGDLALNVPTATLSCTATGRSIRLGEKELKILEYMMTNRNQIITREQLAVKIWGFENEAEYNNVEVYMSFTRKKLTFVGSSVELKAVRGLGYELRDSNV